MKAIIVLKSGNKIAVPMKDGGTAQGVIDEVLSGINPLSSANFYRVGNFLLNINEIAAIYPEEWDMVDEVSA